MQISKNSWLCVDVPMGCSKARKTQIHSQRKRVSCALAAAQTHNVLRLYAVCEEWEADETQLSWEW